MEPSVTSRHVPPARLTICPVPPPPPSAHRYVPTVFAGSVLEICWAPTRRVNAWSEPVRLTTTVASVPSGLRRATSVTVSEEP